MLPFVVNVKVFFTLYATAVYRPHPLPRRSLRAVEMTKALALCYHYEHIVYLCMHIYTEDRGLAIATGGKPATTVLGNHCHLRRLVAEYGEVKMRE